ncbi:MAG: hypothetical protein N4A76_10270 [Firmicutes bacterium]|jgi:predicted membrane protein|nr:hypothetical protein [Bacillota bacterium]
MAFPIELIINLCGLALMFFLVKSILEKEVSSVKLMIMGIGIILVGGIIVLDPSSYLGGAEYMVVLGGLAVTMVGFSRYD